MSFLRQLPFDFFRICFLFPCSLLTHDSALPNSPSRARTYNPTVNSRVLYHWAIEENSIASQNCGRIFDSSHESIWHTLKTEHESLIISTCFRLLSALRKSLWEELLVILPAKIALAIFAWLSPRPISTYQLNTLLCLHLKPIYLVVFKGSYLTGISHLEGGFTLRCLQRLSLPDLATLPWRWSPTGTPAVRPSRSSRTKDSSSQISYACAG